MIGYFSFASLQLSQGIGTPHGAHPTHFCGGLLLSASASLPRDCALRIAHCALIYVLAGRAFFSCKKRIKRTFLLPYSADCIFPLQQAYPAILHFALCILHLKKSLPALFYLIMSAIIPIASVASGMGNNG